MESNETPINPYRVLGDLMKVLDPKSSFVTADSGNTRDQTSTVYEAQIPRGHLGWGNVSTLGFSLAGGGGAPRAPSRPPRVGWRRRPHSPRANVYTPLSDYIFSPCV